MSRRTNTPEATPMRPATWRVALSWAAVVAMAGFIFWMSANTGSSVYSGLGIISALKEALTTAAAFVFGPGVDVSPVGHFTEYFIFALLLATALRNHVSPRTAALGAIAIASAYGITDEIHQIFVPGRSCDPVDWLVDTVAAVVACAIWLIVVNRRVTIAKKR